MQEGQMDVVRKRFQQIVKEKGTMKTAIANILGYRGKTTTQITSVTNLLKGTQEMLVEHGNSISNFYRYPIGYFLFGDENSIYKNIDEEKIRKKIIKIFELEKSKPKKERKAKYQLGKYLGYAGDQTSQLNTTNRTLSGNRKMRMKDIFIFSHFFNLPIEFFLE